MVSIRTLPLALASLTAAMALIALFAPWWGGETSSSFAFQDVAGSDSGSWSAGPFDDGAGAISSGQATLTGILLVVALGGALTGVAAAVREGRTLGRVGVLGTGVAAFLLLLLPLLAVTTWPDGVAFWDRQAIGSEAAGASLTAAAQIGWYAAVAGLLAGAGATLTSARAFLSLPQERSAPEA